MIELRKIDGQKSGAIVQDIVNHYFGYEVKVSHRESGAPFLVGLPVDQSKNITISHTKSYVAVIISDEPCGVDIESVDRDTSRVESRFASLAEKAICRAVFPHNPALMVWCAKEALYKFYDQRGVDFMRDVEVTGASLSRLSARIFQESVELEWRVMDCENILLVHTKYGT